MTTSPASAPMQLALPMPAAFPQFWIMKRCPHWDAAHNRRFRLLRIDGPANYCGRHPSHIWDAETAEWRDQRIFGGTAGHQVARQARPDEVPIAAARHKES